MNRRHLLAAGAVLAAAVPARADTPATPRAVAERFAAALSAHDLTAFGALLADDYINHQVSAAAPPPPPGTPAKAGSLALFAGRLAGLPDLKVEIEALVEGGDKVAASFVYTGTQTAPFLGVAPTGRKLRFTSCDIFRVKDGKIVEHWGMGDIAGVAAQLKA